MNQLKIIPFAGFILLAFLITGRIIFLKKRAVKVSAGIQSTNFQTLILYLLFLLILLVWFMEIAKPVFNFEFSFLPEFATQPFFDMLIFEIIGTTSVLAALFLMVVSLLHFKKSLRFGLDEDNQGELITTGVFSFSRNPLFLSLDLYFAGVALIFPNLFFTGFAVLGVVGIHLFIRKEEKFLKDVYGEEYKKYAKKARRYF